MQWYHISYPKVMLSSKHERHKEHELKITVVSQKSVLRSKSCMHEHVYTFIYKKYTDPHNRVLMFIHEFNLLDSISIQLYYTAYPKPGRITLYSSSRICCRPILSVLVPSEIFLSRAGEASVLTCTFCHYNESLPRISGFPW